MATSIETQGPTIPPHRQALPGSLNVPIATFPAGAAKAPALKPAEIASVFLTAWNDALGKANYSHLADSFVEEGYWRDHLALSWAFRTAQSPSRIAEFLQSCAKSNDGFRLWCFEIDESSDVRKPQFAAVSEDLTGVQFFTKISTAVGSGVGVVKLVEQNGQWKVFGMFTRLDEIRGHEEVTGARRPRGVEHGGLAGRKNWMDLREETQAFDKAEPAVLIIGAGQAGLTAAARLKMLGVEALMIDQNERVGDNWRKRYHQLVLHDPVWYDHMPYLKFPSHWPIFTPKDKLAQFFEAYANLLELNVWTSTELVRSQWDDEKRGWTVVVKRKREDGSVEERVLHPRHIIQATGHSGKKNQPDIPGVETFRGTRLCHSSEFPGALELKPNESRKAIVIGSCNSAHDICQDYLERGYDITMVQRSTTHVVSSGAIVDIALKALYSEDGPTVEEADLLLHGLSTSVLKAVQIKVCEQEAEHDKELLDGLARAGFKVDRGPDGAGLLLKYFQRGGGYYIDVGASQLIADGKIKVKQGQGIEKVLPHGLRFTDGTELEADEIIFATGYQNMRTQTRIMFGDAVADRVGDVWGFNEEGEMRVMWQDSGHPGFWFHGGNLAICRYYSKLLALQIKAQEEGLYEAGEA